MSEQAIFSSLLDTLQKKYKRNNGSIIDEESVNKDESIAIVFDFDSLDMIEVFIEIQDRFGVDIPDEDLNELYSINDIAAYIVNKSVWTPSNYKRKTSGDSLYNYRA